MRRLAAVALLAASVAPPAAPEPLRPSGPAVVRAGAVALVLSGQDGGAVPLSLLAIPPLPGSRTAAVVAEVSGAAISEDYEAPVLRVDVIVYVLGPGNEAVAHAASRFALDLARHGEELARSGLRVVFALEVPPGEHRVRLLVRSENGALGLATAELPALDGMGPLPPLFAPAARRWVTALSETDEAALAKAWAGLGEAVARFPSSRPVLAAESPRELVLVAPGDGGPVPRAVLENGHGETLEVPLAVRERLSGAPPGITTWSATLDAAGVEPGVYRLSASWGKLRSPALPVVVTPPGAATGQVWTEVDTSRLARGIELPPANVEAGAVLAEQEIAAGYAAALRELASGDRPAALEGLYALETGVLASFEPEPLQVLGRVESETLSTLLEGAWGALLPVALLHAQAAAGYRAARQSALAGHSEHLVLVLARTYVERVGGDEARRDASRILAGIADERRRLGTLASAERVYRQALEIDPGNEDLVLAVAAIQERWGRYPEAVATLEGLPAPGRESRLRLALNLLRTGHRARAERTLRQLAREAGGDDWIGVLAAEELAGIELERRGPEAAAEVLRNALGSWPGHRTLRLQLAFVLDRHGRSDEATEILEEIGAGPAARSAPGSDHERMRYNDWPRPGADTGRREMMDRASERLADLERVFERLGELAAEDP